MENLILFMPKASHKTNFVLLLEQNKIQEGVSYGKDCCNRNTGF